MSRSQHILEGQIALPESIKKSTYTQQENNWVLFAVGGKVPDKLLTSLLPKLKSIPDLSLLTITNLNK